MGWYNRHDDCLSCSSAILFTSWQMRFWFCTTPSQAPGSYIPPYDARRPFGEICVYLQLVYFANGWQIGLICQLLVKYTNRRKRFLVLPTPAARPRVGIWVGIPFTYPYTNSINVVGGVLGATSRTRSEYVLRMTREVLSIGHEMVYWHRAKRDVNTPSNCPIDKTSSVTHNTYELCVME